MDKNYLVVSMYQNGIGYSKIAKILNITTLEVNRILDNNGIKRTDSKTSLRDNEICNSYLRGKQISQIAKELSINRHTVTAVLKKYGVYLAVRGAGSEQQKLKRDEEIVRLYKSGMSLRQTAEKIGVCPGTVRKVVKAAGEVLRPQHMEGHGLGTKKNRGHRKHIFDESFFHAIDTEEKAYWLGFLYADGYVGYDGVVALALQEADLDRIQAFQKAIQADDTQIKYSSLTKSYKITVNSIEMSTDLANKGCFQRKSLLLKFPTNEQVPENLIHHFMRGYFDGDGCISISGEREDPEFSILGTPEFLDGFELRIQKATNDFSPHKRIRKDDWNRQTESLIRGGNCKIEDIRDFLYKDATVYMNRKKEKFDKVQHRRPRAKS